MADDEKEVKASDEALKIHQQFDNGNSFKVSLNLIRDITRSVMFENGTQWNMDDDIKEFPKITLNMIKQIGKVRKSNIMQNEYSYLVNSTNFKSVRKIQNFLKYQAAVVKMKAKDLKALNDDYIKGTSIGYFYWDAEKRGFMKKSGGEMRYEIVDIRKFVVADPYLQSLQDQAWVIFVTQETITSLKRKYGERADNVVADSNKYTNGTEKEQNTITSDDELVNVYTKFYRNFEGQVFFKIATETVLLKDATPLNPFYTKKDSEIEEEPSTTFLPDEKEKEEEDERGDYVWNLYPFCRLCLNERDNCFYGIPITLEYIEAQKSINNHFSVYDKALQDNVLGGYVYREGALDPEEVTAENGNMIKLNIMPNEPISNAFGRLPTANVPNDSQAYSNNLINITRSVSGASNIQLGAADYAGQSGKQTQLLLERAKENASDTAMLFNQFKQEQAEIMFLFAKFFYDKRDFSVIEHGYQTDKVETYEGDNTFDGREYLDDDVIIDIKVGAAPSFSEYNNIQLMGLMVQSGQLPPEAYLTTLPDDQYSNKQELLQILKDNSAKQIAALQQKLEQMGKVMEQMADAYKETQKDRGNIDTVIRENEMLKSMLAEVSAKAISRVKEADAQSQEVIKDMQGVMGIIGNKK